jgi:hypothetical protein
MIGHWPLSICTLLVLVTGSTGSDPAALSGTTTTITSTTGIVVSTTTSTNPECATPSLCQHNAHCIVCFDALAQFSIAQDRQILQREKETAFFFAAQRLTACRNSTAVSRALTAQASSSCSPRFDKCQRLEYTCLLDSACAQCITDVFSFRNESARLLLSPACEQTDPQLLREISSACAAFPACSFAKQQCTGQCQTCWEHLNRGDAAGARRAAEACPPPTAAATHINDLAYFCIGPSALGCEFWTARCVSNPTCAACHAALAGGIRAIARGAIGPKCAPLHTSPDLLRVVTSIVYTCPRFTLCPARVSQCAIESTRCGECIVEYGHSPPQSSSCADLLGSHGVTSSCTACPPEVFMTNDIVLATQVVGVVSVILCIAVVTVILAHGRDQTSMRDRIVIGLMLANAV